MLKWRTPGPQFMGSTVCLEIRSRTQQSKLRSNQIKTVVICQLHPSYRIKFRILSKCWFFSLEFVIAIWASTILQIKKCVKTNLYSYFDYLSQRKPSSCPNEWECMYIVQCTLYMLKL